MERGDRESIDISSLDREDTSQKRRREDSMENNGVIGSSASDVHDVMDLTSSGNSPSNPQHGASGHDQSRNINDSDTLSFLTEAGLSEDVLASLGINLAEIRAQKEIEERLEREARQLEFARQVQADLDQEAQREREDQRLAQEAHSTPAIATPVRVSSPVRTHSQQSSDDRSVKRIKTDPTLSERSTVMVEPFTNAAGSRAGESSSFAARRIANNVNAIEIPSDDDEVQEGHIIDLTNDYEDLTLSSQERSLTPSVTLGVNMRHGPHGYGCSCLSDDETDYDEESEPRDFVTHLLDEIQRGHVRQRALPGHSHSSGSRNFGSGFERPLNPEQSEKELRALLENVQDEEPPSPEERTGTPDGLKVTLLEHQKIGLQWMKKMEESSNKGGILSDDMGLGKTVQAMAIMVDRTCQDATPLRPSHGAAPARHMTKRRQEQIKSKATLVVCPVSLIAQWKREIEDKTEPPLSICVYHGSDRLNDERDIARFDVVITSYNVVGGDFPMEEDRRGPLAYMKFHRVVLDEAHTIKNKRTKMAESCCRIDAEYRWCLTATPIQNKIDELYSLIRFLRIRPYCEWEEFRDEISKPMKTGRHKKALQKTQILLKAISLRRSKKAKIDGRPILVLPERNVHFTHVDFSPDERHFYDYVNAKAQARFNKYVAAGTVMKNYSSVLVLLLRLRQACLHPSLTMVEGVNGETEAPEESTTAAEKMPKSVVTRLLHDADLSHIECPICMDMADQAQIIADCGHILCRECLFNYLNTNDGIQKRCPQCRGPLSRENFVSIETFAKVHAPDLYKEEFEKKNEASSEEQASLARAREFISSTKIDKMLEVLDETRRTTEGKDKTIVFSQFTSMLDLIERPLRDNGHKFVRYDGSMTVSKRDATLATFFSDPNVTVLLVSTKCGSLGLNLTVANRVIMMDVWWNPALENQAIDRVHRIGQVKDVDVHRIFVNDTVEDRILELQRQKQALCDGALGEGTGQRLGRLGLQEMLYLFRGGPPPPGMRVINDDD